jgi:Tfp pilus assembly protein PilN
MPTKLNLASKPFSNRSLPWVVTALVVTVSMICLIYVVRATRQANAQASAVQADVNNLSSEERDLREKAQAVMQSLTPEQFQALGAAHTLVDRKHFSWSRLFADLESALPGNVRVKRIAVREVATRGDETFAELELTVVAKASTTIIDMIADMASAGVFRAEIRTQTLQRGRGEVGAEYELLVNYKPRAGAPSSMASAPSIARGVSTGGGQ